MCQVTFPVQIFPFYFSESTTEYRVERVKLLDYSIFLKLSLKDESGINGVHKLLRNSFLRRIVDIRI